MNKNNSQITRSEQSDVLLIYPPLHRLYGERKQWMPLSILYLSSYLNEHGISAKAYNADCSLEEPECVMSYTDRFQAGKNFLENLNSKNAIWDEIEKVLENIDPKIVGISVFTEALGSTKKLINVIRKKNPFVRIIAGGPHAEIDPQYLLKNFHVDYVIKGDGEKTLYDLSKMLLCGLDPSLLMGNNISNNIITSVRIDVNELPIPKLEYHYNYEQYRKVGRKLNVSTSRGGCVYACKFCYCSKFKYSLQFRTPERVIDEIAYYIKYYNTKKIFFVDDTFTINRQYIVDICNLIIKRKLIFSWTCTTRAKQVDVDLLTLMKLAGCKSIHIGVESGSPRMLELIDKKININDVINSSMLIKNAGIESRLFFMAGLPTETPNDLRLTIDLIKRVRPDETIMSMYVPIPGTPLFDLICNEYYPFEKVDWTTFSRDKVPYHYYINDIDGTYDQTLNELYKLVEEMNS